MPSQFGRCARPVCAWSFALSGILCYSTPLYAQSGASSHSSWPAQPGSGQPTETHSAPRAAFSQGFRPLAPISEYHPTEQTPPSAEATPAAGKAVVPPTVPAVTAQPAAHQVEKIKAEAVPKPDHAAEPAKASTAAALPLSRPGKENNGESKADSRVGSTGSQLGMTVVALTAVLLLIVVLAKILKKHTPLAGKSLPEEALDLLGRKMIDQRNAVQFLRIGDRILVVGVSLEGMRTLAEITDPVEVDRIAGACRTPAGESAMGRSFRFLLSRQNEERSTEAPAPKSKQRSSPRKRFSLPSAPAGFSWETPDDKEDSGISQDDIAELTRTLQQAREGQS